MDISSIALGGFEQAQLQLQSAAGQLASATTATPGAPATDTVDLSVAAAAMISAKIQASVSLDTMKVADAMQKASLSVLG